ncbi:hypothetical protein H4K36_15530 [Streptomyces sp. DHE7-1]|nr:hypothetical protein [Streptomyces sp. DHE7-1]
MYAPYAGSCREAIVRAITTSPYRTQGVTQWYPAQGVRYRAATGPGSASRPATYPSVPTCVHAPTSSAAPSAAAHPARTARRPADTVSSAAASWAGISAAGSARPHE